MSVYMLKDLSRYRIVFRKDFDRFSFRVFGTIVPYLLENEDWSSSIYDSTLYYYGKTDEQFVAVVNELLEVEGDSRRIDAGSVDDCVKILSKLGYEEVSYEETFPDCVCGHSLMDHADRNMSWDGEDGELVCMKCRCSGYCEYEYPWYD